MSPRDTLARLIGADDVEALHPSLVLALGDLLVAAPAQWLNVKAAAAGAVAHAERAVADATGHGTKEPLVTVAAGALIQITDLGIYLRCDRNDPEFGRQPYVTINTEQLLPEHTYDEADPSKPGGMPKIAVHLGDCTLYDDSGSGYATDLRATEAAS